MKYSFFKKIFEYRPYRLFAFFMFSFSFNIILAFNAPLWALLFGPLILGVPHLISSVRYLPRFVATDFSELEKTKLFYNLIGLSFFLVAGLRFFLDKEQFVLLNRFPFLVEACLSVFSVLVILYLTRQSYVNVVKGLLFLLFLFYMLVKFPLLALGVFVIAHNFVAFIFWIKRASYRDDILAALFALGVFLAASIFIFNGNADQVLSATSDEIMFGFFNTITLGQQIFSEADIVMSRRLVSIYALGQGLHYFVWLKALPELELSFMNSTSITHSFKKLQNDIGKRIIWISLVLFLGFLFYGILKSWSEARTIYLYLAAFHGYLELTSLIFTKEQSR